MLLCFGTLTFTVGCVVFNYSGGFDAWNFSLLILGLAGMLCALPASADSATAIDRLALWAAILFPAYAAFQLLPLPLPLVRIISPTRAAIGDAVAAVMPALHFSPLTIGPPRTWTYLLRIAVYALIFLLVWQTARHSSTKRTWALAVPLILMGAIEAIWGVVQHSTGVEFASGTYFNKDHYAGLLEMVLPFATMYAIALLYRGRGRENLSAATTIVGVGLVLLAATIVLAITYSLSRMGFISMLGSLFLMGALALKSRLKSWKIWPAIAGLAALALLAFVFLPPSELVEHFGNLAGESRGPIWKDTLHLIAAFPLFGCGLGNYYPGLLPYQTSALQFSWLEAHNDYLQLLSELGIIGFLIPAALMCLVVARAARTAVSSANREVRFLGLACAGGIAALLIHGLADFNLYDTANAMVLSWISGLAAGLPVSDREQAGEHVGRTFVMRRTVMTLASLVSLYAAAWLVFLHVFNSDVRAERAFCHFGICDTEALERRLQLLHRARTVGALPPADVFGLLRRDPADPSRWCDLGDALQNAGHTGRARHCYSEGLALGPHIPSTLFRAAEFHFSLGENRTALELLASALRSDPSSDHTVFVTYKLRHIAPEEILRYGLPDRRSSQEYLRFLIDEEKNTDADKTWNWIASHRYADDKLANEYVSFLMSRKEYEAAQQAWATYTAPWDKCYPQSNRVFNGDFEFDSRSSPFDWRIEPALGTAIDFDRRVHYSGSRSLRIQFDGTENVGSIGVGQTILLKPGRYCLQAYVRTKDLSTDEGVAFSVTDSEAPNRLSFATESMSGSSDWKRIEHAFQVLPGTRFVQVSLVRKPSLRFDNLIHGTAWVDQVSVRETSADLVNHTRSLK